MKTIKYYLARFILWLRTFLPKCPHCGSHKLERPLGWDRDYCCDCGKRV